ncbi:MAG: GSCFA domain-containing protein [Burkholderiales bacterium]|nr:MAG: GSCFA domain-containing protein [Burkholderiales bacterium]
MHPYQQQPDRAFWRRAVSDTAWRDLDLIGTPKFQLTPDAQVATAGSCFAQHIARHMRQRGMQPMLVERPHPLEQAAGRDSSDYQTFSARFGNLYSPRQALELAEQALGVREPIDDYAKDEGRVYDLLRPNAVKGGFDSLAHARADRRFHLGRVRHMFEACDVFVFTLGLTETWYHAQRGHTYPVCPGTAKGTYDPAQHQFRNLTQAEVLMDLQRLVALVREVNRRVRFIFTVSPVPLVATCSGQHVLLASSYSKSTLRSACGELAAADDGVLYFPSFEIVSHVASFGQYLQGDLREVTERGVGHVMDCFFHALYPGLAPAVATAAAAPPAAAPAAAPGPDLARLLQTECEELFNDRPVG